MPSDTYRYFTTGAFQFGVSMREFYIASIAEAGLHVESLAWVTHFHSFPEHELGNGSIVDLGRPWMEGSMHHHFLVSWPYSIDRRAAICATPSGDVTYLWLIPIAESEARFARQNGVEALEDLLEKNEVDPADPYRKAVV